MDMVADKLIDIFEGLITWLFDSLIEPFLGLSTLKELVFGRVNEGKLVWGTFHASDLTDALSPLFYSMMTLAGFILVAMVVMSGIRIASAPLNPSRRNETIEFIKDLFLVGIVLVNLPTLYDLLFTINSALVGMFSGAYESSLDELSEARSEEASGVIGFIFIQLILLGLAIWANFYYLMRKVTLIILMAMGPAMLVLYLQPQFKGITGAWLRELVGSIFVQTIHAFVFWTVATISANSAGFIETVIVYLIFIPISESMRRLLNMGGEMQGGLAKAGSMLGMAGLAGMYGSVKGAMGDKSVMSAIKGAYNGTKDRANGIASGKGEPGDDLKNTVGASAGGDIGTSPRAEKMLRAGDIMGKMGKATFGMAGSIAGSPLGPVGAMAGASAGFGMGGVIGGVTGRAGAATVQGLADRIKKGKDAAKGVNLKNDDFDKDLVNEMADRDTASWAERSKDSVMNDLQERFPDANPKQLESLFNDEKEKKRQGFYEGAKANYAAASKNADGKVSGNQLVASSSKAMANAWGNENEQTFNEDYNKNNPQMPNETNSDFNARRGSAFNQKKDEMKNVFAEMGQQYVSQHSPNGDEPLDKTGFSNHMGQAIKKASVLGNASNLRQASDTAIDNVQSANGKVSGNKLVETSSQAMANAWGSENEQAFNEDYNKNNSQKPNETKQDFNARRGTAFNHKKDAMKNVFAEMGQEYVSQHSPDGDESLDKVGFANHMGEAIKKASVIGNANKLRQASDTAIDNVQSASGKVSGNKLVETSSQAMANAWGTENEQVFNEDYNKNNPQKANETKQDFNTRQGTAFIQKKAQMKDAFVDKGQQYISTTAADGNEPIDKQEFSNHMGQAIQGISGVGNTEKISQASEVAIDHVQGASLFNKKGKPNTMFLAGSLANGRTKEMGQAFVAEQTANGVSEINANKDWNQNHKTQAHANNLSMYRDSIESATESNFAPGAVGVAQRLGQKLKMPQVTSFVGAATGVTPLLKATNEGVNAGLSTLMTGRDGTGGSIRNVGPAFQDAYSSSLNSLVEQQGGVVESQANYQNSAGYIGGVFAGAKGYQVSKKLASKFTPIRQQVQDEIQSPGEVIQMAQTVTDDHGNVQVAPGAIRQVTTPSESYIEVQTKTGDTQVVSRKGSGHSGLKQGDKVYQDLAAQGDTLVVSSANGSPSSTYRLDSAGGRVPSSVNVESHPSTLLGNPSIGQPHKPKERPKVSSYNQAVDNGKFYVGDITDQGMENVQVVVEKDRQFVTAQKDGSTYRVSPLYSGDSRLGNNETVHIPVSVKQQRLVPTQTPNSTIGVQSFIQSNPTSYTANTDKVDTPYYSSRDVSTLMESKHADRANNSVGKRQELDTVRRKQGLLG